MHIRHLTAVSVLTAMGALAGCGADEPGEPNASGETAYESTAEPAPAPESAVPGTEPTTGREMAGTDEPMTTQPEQPRTTGDYGTEPGMVGEQIGMTEFAALDTNSDGKLAESEWQSDVVEGMGFDDIDEDSSGDIDQEEFRQALSMSGTGESQTMQPEAEPEQTTPDPTTP